MLKREREEKFNIIIKLKNKGYNLSEICDIIDDLNKSEVEKSIIKTNTIIEMALDKYKASSFKFKLI